MSVPTVPTPGSRAELEHLLVVAKNQRGVMWCILAQIGLLIVGFAVKPPAMLQGGLALLVSLVSIVFTARLSRAVFGIVAAVIAVTMLVLPFVCAFVATEVAPVTQLLALVTLLVVNQRATKVLQTAGFKVGLMGGNPADVQARLTATPPG